MKTILATILLLAAGASAQNQRDTYVCGNPAVPCLIMDVGNGNHGQIGRIPGGGIGIGFQGSSPAVALLPGGGVSLPGLLGSTNTWTARQSFSDVGFTPSGANGPATYSEKSVNNGNDLDEHFRILSGTTTGVWIDALDQSLVASTQPWTMTWGAAPCLDAECSPLGPQFGGGIYRIMDNIGDGDGSISEFDATFSTPGGWSHRLYGAASQDFSETNFLDFESRQGISLTSSGGGTFNISPTGDVEAGSITASTVTSTGDLYANGAIIGHGDLNLDGGANIGNFLWAKNGLQVDTGAVINGGITINDGATINGGATMNGHVDVDSFSVTNLAVFFGTLVGLHGLAAESPDQTNSILISNFGDGNSTISISTAINGGLFYPIKWECSDPARGSASGCAMHFEASSMTLTNLPTSGFSGANLLWADDSGIVYATNTITDMTIGDPQASSAVVDMVYKCTGSTSALMDGAIAAGNSNAALCAGGTWLPTALQLVTIPPTE